MASSGVPPGPPKALHQPNAPSIARAADRPLCNPGYTSSARRVLPRWTMDGPTPSRAIKNSGMPVSSLVLSIVFHVSIIFALIWSPPTTSTPLMPEDAIEVTIERQTASSAAMIQSMAIPEPPVDSPPIQPDLPAPPQPVPQVEAAQTPTLENAVPEPEPPPEVALRDFPKAESVVRKIEEKKPSPKSDPKPDLNKAFEPPPGGTQPNASPPTPLPNRA